MSEERFDKLEIYKENIAGETPKGEHKNSSLREGSEEGNKGVLGCEKSIDEIAAKNLEAFSEELGQDEVEKIKNVIDKLSRRHIIMLSNLSKHISIEKCYKEMSWMAEYNILICKRDVYQYTQPYRGEKLSNITISSIWDLPINPPSEIVQAKEKDCIWPGSEEVLRCGNCNNGMTICSSCGGYGVIEENVYNSNLRMWEKKTKACYSCQGTRTVICNNCRGTGYLVRYRYISTRYFVKKYNNLYYQGDMPKKYLYKVKMNDFYNSIIYEYNKSEIEQIIEEGVKGIEQIKNTVEDIKKSGKAENRHVLSIAGINFAKKLKDEFSSFFKNEFLEDNQKIVRCALKLKYCDLKKLQCKLRNKVGFLYIYNNDRKMYVSKMLYDYRKIILILIGILAITSGPLGIYAGVTLLLLFIIIKIVKKLIKYVTNINSLTSVDTLSDNRRAEVNTAVKHWKLFLSFSFIIYIVGIVTMYYGFNMENIFVQMLGFLTFVCGLFVIGIFSFKILYKHFTGV